MATVFTDVLPGDVITADLMNRMMHELQAQDVRLTKLETAGPVVVGPTPPVITGLSPSAATGVHVGEDLHLLGQGFGLPTQNVITIDGIRITTINSGSDTELVFTVPNLQGVGTGKAVAITLSNPAGSASTATTVLPAVITIPSGQVFANLSPTSPPTSPVAGQSFTYVFDVKGIVDLDETFTLAATAVTTTGQQWTATIVDASDNPLVPAEIFLAKATPPASTTQQARVRVAIPSGTAIGTTASLKLSVTSKRKATITTQSGGDSIVVGSAGPVGQNNIVVSYNNTTGPTGQPAATDVNNVTTIPAVNQDYRMNLSVIYKTKGTYRIQAIPIADAKWGIHLAGSVAFIDLPIAADGENHPLPVFVKAQVGAPAANFVVRIVNVADVTNTTTFTRSIKSS
jgi:hypothetical protein